MTRIREPDLEPPLVSHRAGAEQATGTAHRMVDGLRALASSIRPNASLGLADAVTSLFSAALRFDAADPHWPDRDRVVLPAATGTEALLAAALDLTGHAGLHAIALDDHPAVEAVTGPAGQTLGVGVGLALAERLLAARFGRSLVDHRTWVLAAPHDLAGGLSHEAASLAGHLGLDRLTVLWEDDGAPGAASAASELRRFAAFGWTTRSVDGRDPGALAAALALAQRSRKPTLIACRAGAYGPVLPVVPPDLQARWQAAGERSAAARRGWKKRATRHALRPEFERATAGRLPDDWAAAIAALRGPDAPPPLPASPSALAHRLSAALAAVVPEFGGGAPGPVAGLAPIATGRFNGRLLPYGQRPLALAACTAGLALHGGVLAFAHADLADADAFRPALRLLAASRQRALVVLHDAGAEPDQVSALRTVPGLHLHRPATTAETAECWEIALRRTDGPSVLVVSTREHAPQADTAENRSARGGYVLAEADGPRQATLIAGGAEVPVALAARAELAASGVAVAVVSLPCRELFGLLPDAETAPVLGHVLRAAVAGADAPGLRRWLGPDDLLIAGPPDEITAGAVAQAVRKRLPIEEEKV